MSGQIHADFLRLTDKQMRSYYKSMGKKDKIGNEAFRWARAKVFNYNKTSSKMANWSEIGNGGGIPSALSERSSDAGTH